MRAAVDPSGCRGHKRCNAICPQVFTLDRWGYAHVEKGTTIPANLLERVREAERSCPEQAIVVTEEE